MRLKLCSKLGISERFCNTMRAVGTTANKRAQYFRNETRDSASLHTSPKMGCRWIVSMIGRRERCAAAFSIRQQNTKMSVHDSDRDIGGKNMRATRDLEPSIQVSQRQCRLRCLTSTRTGVNGAEHLLCWCWIDNESERWRCGRWCISNPNIMFSCLAATATLAARVKGLMTRLFRSYGAYCYLNHPNLSQDAISQAKLVNWVDAITKINFIRRKDIWTRLHREEFVTPMLIWPLSHKPNGPSAKIANKQTTAPIENYHSFISRSQPKHHHLTVEDNRCTSAGAVVARTLQHRDKGINEPVKE